MSDLLKELFMLSRRERNGVIFLLALIIASQIVRYALVYFVHPPVVDLSGSDYIKFMADTSHKNVAYAAFEKKAEQSTGIIPGNLQPFDPNSLDEQGWRDLGFSDKQVSGILKFREKSGGFRSKADLKKLYVMSDDIYARIAPFVMLPDSYERPDYGNYENNLNYSDNENYSSNGNYSLPRVEAQRLRLPLRLDGDIIELNSADTTELKKIRGFGSFTAKKIVAYRDRLGGFRDVSQLLEVWPIRPGLLDSVSVHIMLDTTLTEKININTVDLERLKNHPYIKAGQAKALLAYREKHGSFYEISDIKKCVLIDEVTFARLKPYLTI